MKAKKNVLVIGAGGVGAVSAHKCAQNNDVLGGIYLASRSIAKCDAAIADIHAKGNLKDKSGTLQSLCVDAQNREAIGVAIKEANADIVINVASPICNMPILDACIEAGVAYIDTAVHEDEDDDYYDFPWYEHNEWKRRDICRDKGVTAVLGSGFDPGVVNAYCAYALKHYFDTIDSIDIMDVNAGNHGKYFATNFDPETNLLEINEQVGYWEDFEWKKCDPHSKSRTYEFPDIGKQTVYLMGHDEIHSLPLNIEAGNIRFWMGFGEHYINCFNVLKNIGMLSPEKIMTTDGIEVAPIRVLKAVLPKPESLAANYTGNTCIGNLVTGKGKDGKQTEVFIYNTCSHEACYQEVNSQAISYTAGVPPVAAAILLRTGEWNVKKMVNVEELDPDPYLELLARMGLPTSVVHARPEQSHVQLFEPSTEPLVAREG
jgi:saccharopine dehydrogenase-like NADP-dependent oxidoreductase